MKNCIIYSNTNTYNTIIDKYEKQNYQFYIFNYSLKLTDHLGNVRVVYTKNDRGLAEIVQTNDYYPFGLIMSSTSLNPSLQGGNNKYLYNGKELQNFTGYYAYGFRQYDPQIGRWFCEDKLAEIDYGTSAYAYCANNPINYSDYMGLLKFSVCEWYSGPIIKRGGSGREIGSIQTSTSNNVDYSQYFHEHTDNENNFDPISNYNENANNLFAIHGSGAGYYSGRAGLSRPVSAATYLNGLRGLGVGNGGVVTRVYNNNGIRTADIVLNIYLYSEDDPNMSNVVSSFEDARNLMNENPNAKVLIFDSQNSNYYKAKPNFIFNYTTVKYNNISNLINSSMGEDLSNNFFYVRFNNTSSGGFMSGNSGFVTSDISSHQIVEEIFHGMNWMYDLNGVYGQHPDDFEDFEKGIILFPSIMKQYNYTIINNYEYSNLIPSTYDYIYLNAQKALIYNAKNPMPFGQPCNKTIYNSFNAKFKSEH